MAFMRDLEPAMVLVSLEFLYHLAGVWRETSGLSYHSSSSIIIAGLGHQILDGTARAARRVVLTYENIALFIYQIM